MVRHSHSILLTCLHTWMYVCTLRGCDGKIIHTFPTFPFTLFQRHSRHTLFEVCVFYRHTHSWWEPDPDHSFQHGRLNPPSLERRQN